VHQNAIPNQQAAVWQSGEYSICVQSLLCSSGDLSDQKLAPTQSLASRLSCLHVSFWIALGPGKPSYAPRSAAVPLACPRAGMLAVRPPCTIAPFSYVGRVQGSSKCSSGDV